MTFFKWKTIYGCDARGDGDSAYMTRLTLFECARGQLCLHFFHRSDADDLHDHPWSFWSLILWRGYYEITPEGRRRKWPGMLLRRTCYWQHRVELVGGKPAVTLVWMGRYVKQWGFWTKGGFLPWKKYFKQKGC